MRRFLSISLLLTSLLAASIGSAQQTSTTSAPNRSSGTQKETQETNNEARPGESLGTKPGFLNGRGATNYVPVWLNPYILGSSVIYQADGDVGIGTTSPAAKLDVNGGIHASGDSRATAGAPPERTSRIAESNLGAPF